MHQRQAVLPRGTAVLLLLLGLATLLLWGVTVFFLRDDHVHMGLVYNILLAALPLLFAIFLRLCLARKISKIIVGFCCVPWLLFLPNAPYMATDLVHLQFYNYNASYDAAPQPYIWLAWAQIIGTAAVGCLLGCLAIYLLHEAVAAYFTPLWGWLLAAFASLACGTGIYIGRFMRFHTIDLVRNPAGLLTDFTERLGQGMPLLCLLFAAVTFGGYTLFYACFAAGGR